MYDHSTTPDIAQGYALFKTTNLEVFEQSVYKEDIFDSYCESEERAMGLRRPEGLNAVQSEVTSDMRNVVVNWLNEVTDEFHLRKETFFLAVENLDRFLERRVLPPQSLQLIGITALFIASKFQEIEVPPLEKFVDITDRSYTHQEILMAERIILCTLKFELCTVTLIDFLQYYLGQLEWLYPKAYYYALYLSELVIGEYSFRLNYRPSQLASAIAYLTQHFITLTNRQNEPHADISRTSLYDCVRAIMLELGSKSNQMLVAKYSKAQYGSVSLIPLM